MWTSLRIYIYKIVDFISGLSGLLYRRGWTSVNGILIFGTLCHYVFPPVDCRCFYTPYTNRIYIL